MCDLVGASLGCGVCASCDAWVRDCVVLVLLVRVRVRVVVLALFACVVCCVRALCCSPGARALLVGCRWAVISVLALLRAWVVLSWLFWSCAFRVRLFRQVSADASACAR